MVEKPVEPSLIMGLDLASGPDESAAYTVRRVDGRLEINPFSIGGAMSIEEARARRDEYLRKHHMHDMFAKAEQTRRAGRMGEAKHSLELGPDDYHAESVHGEATPGNSPLALRHNGRQDRRD